MKRFVNRILNKKRHNRNRCAQGYHKLDIWHESILLCMTLCKVGADDSFLIILPFFSFVNIQNRRFFVEFFVQNDTEYKKITKK